jgi:hypothetical protein
VDLLEDLVDVQEVLEMPEVSPIATDPSLTSELEVQVQVLLQQEQ